MPILVDNHRILGLAHLNDGQVRDQRVIQECAGVGAGHPDFAHVGEVEQATGGANSPVLFQLVTVFERHVPRAEGGEGSAQLFVFGVEGGLTKFSHGFLSSFFLGKVFM